MRVATISCSMNNDISKYDFRTFGTAEDDRYFLWAMMQGIKRDKIAASQIDVAPKAISGTGIGLD